MLASAGRLARTLGATTNTMSVRGWIYVLENKSLSGLVKIGFSTKDPSLRATELSTTGLPHPFELAFEALTENPRALEQLVHAKLKNEREAKEFFRLTVHRAISVIEGTAKESGFTLELARSFVGTAPSPAIHRFIPPGWLRCAKCGAPRSPTDDTACPKCHASYIPKVARAYSAYQCQHCGATRHPKDTGVCSRCFEPLEGGA